LSPGLPIVLRGPKMRIPIYGLVDSGASDTLIPLDLMAHLGIDSADCDLEPIGTAGGTSTQLRWRQPLTIDERAQTFSLESY
jgi:hypothetical protein